MKEKRRPDRLDLEAIRNQILDFACAKHDFKLESEDFPFDGNWNGVFLVKFKDDSGQQYDNRSPLKLKRAYYRMAKIAPCFISTFHSLPWMFTGFDKNEPVYIWEEANLLIVDEAGQVSPEVGMSGFALAKRALLVGDTAQIEPVWNIPPKIDKANARKLGVIDTGDDNEEHHEHGLLDGVCIVGDHQTEA